MFKRLGEGEPEKRITGGTWQVHEIAIPGPIKIKLYWSTALSIIYILATAASSYYGRVEEFGRDSKAQKGSNVYYLEPLQEQFAGSYSRRFTCTISVLSTTHEELKATTFTSQTKEQKLNHPAAQSHGLMVVECRLEPRQPETCLRLTHSPRPAGAQG